MAYINLPALNWNNYQTLNLSDLQTYFNQYNDSINAFANAIAISESGVTKLNPAKVKLTQFGLNGITADAITGADISNALLKGVQDFTFQTATGAPAFSATDNDTVAWSAFTLIFSDGSQYPIDAGNTGNVSTSVVSYVYWDKALSLSVLQTTTDFTLTVGDNKKLCCVVWGTADTAQKAGFVPAVGVFGANSLNILANSVSAATIQAGAVTSAKINVAQLSAISADMGSLTAGSIVVGSTNKLWLNDGADGALNIGGSVKASAPFQVTAAGVMTATGATLKSAGSGQRIEILSSSNAMDFYDSGVQVGSLYGFDNVGAHEWRFDCKSATAVKFLGGLPLDLQATTSVAPFLIGSTLRCVNLNADLLDGNHASAFASSSGANYSNWDTAYSDRMKWDGGSTGLNATTGRASLGLGSLATVNVGQSGSFPDFNANVITVVDGIITAGL